MSESLRLDEMIASAKSGNREIADQAEQVIERVRNEKASELSRIYDVIILALNNQQLNLTEAMEKVNMLDEVSNETIGYSISKLLGIPFSRELPYVKEKTDYQIVDSIKSMGNSERLLYIDDSSIYGTGDKKINLPSISKEITGRSGMADIYCLDPRIENFSIIAEGAKKYSIYDKDLNMNDEALEIIHDRLDVIEQTRVVLPGRALCYTQKGKFLEFSKSGLIGELAHLPKLQDLTIDSDGTIYGYRSEDAAKETRNIFRFSPANNYQIEEFHETSDFPDIVCSGKSVVLRNSSSIKIINKETKQYTVIELDENEFEVIELQPLPNGNFFALIDKFQGDWDGGNTIAIVKNDGSIQTIGSAPEDGGFYDAYMSKEGKVFTLNVSGEIKIWDGAKK